METTNLTVTLELSFAGDSLSGRLIEEDGSERTFSGWMGLVAVLDRLASPRAEDESPAA